MLPEIPDVNDRNWLTDNNRERRRIATFRDVQIVSGEVICDFGDRSESSANRNLRLFSWLAHRCDLRWVARLRAVEREHLAEPAHQIVVHVIAALVETVAAAGIQEQLPGLAGPIIEI